MTQASYQSFYLVTFFKWYPFLFFLCVLLQMSFPLLEKELPAARRWWRPESDESIISLGPDGCVSIYGPRLLFE